MRAGPLLCFLGIAGWMASASGMEPACSPAALDGTWTGSRNGAAVSWDMTADGRLRIDGRGADYVVCGDSLLVTFDRLDPASRPETAVYRFTPETGAARLFVYGFDLGKQGLVLHRARAVPELAEDAAPAPPPIPPQPAVSQAPPSAPGAR